MALADSDFCNICRVACRRAGEGTRPSRFVKRATEVMAKKVRRSRVKEKYELVSSANLRKGDFILVEAGEIIPGDGEVV